MGALSAEIAKVRDTLQDEDSTSYRTSDTKLVGYANDFVRELALLRPDLFSTIGDIANTAGEVLQSAPAGSLVLVDVFRVKGKKAITESRRAVLDRFNPDWPNDDADDAETWVRHDKDPNKFFIHPKAPSGQILVGQWAALPTPMADANAQIPSQVHEAYYPALHHYMVFRAEIKDDEFAVNGRALNAYNAYAALVGAGKVTKAEAEKQEKESASQATV